MLWPPKRPIRKAQKPFAASDEARKLRTIFFGSSEFAVPSLRALAGAHDVAGVYMQADRPAGRGLKLTQTPAKIAALELGLSVATPEKLDAGEIARVAALRPHVLATVSYGKILPAELLQTASLAALNVHPSLLPQYRGATPIQAALRDGRRTTGVSVIWMSPRMDAGDIALARPIAILDEDDYRTLHDRLATLGAALLLEALHELGAGRLERVPQDDGKATYTKLLTTDDRRLDFDADPRDVINLIRSLSPKPAAWTMLSGIRVKLLLGDIAASGAGVPGTVLGPDGDGLVVACRTGAVRLLRVIPEGKPSMSGAMWYAGLQSGE